MAGTGEDDVIIGPPVQNVLREVANLSNDKVQQVFKGIAKFPPVCAAILNRTATILTTVFWGVQRGLEGGFRQTATAKRATKESPANTREEALYSEEAEGSRCG